MTDPTYAGKSNEQIINEQAASLEEKSHYQHGARFHPGGATATSLESGVNESGVAGFPTASGMEQVSVGRTGQTGGGTSDQWIPPREGGDHKTGEDRASAFGGGVKYGPTGSRQ
ncbi:uncharacterized protein C8Q71DRAFT_725925 [Rhodofomes roseus]|uniref:Uncharacterized protein n=1 Tax=Rhodofomes roseus TaxID=34475 RepID=A0ABQ8K7S2_9APHY|nr:uncharacterized protein C8Q71DRAFT_725925 [Rhodofomes roseus]KAH9833290.1 hypothetical protein C8Q71DRAFT_725925 [Rhodofomes roseus]